MTTDKNKKELPNIRLILSQAQSNPEIAEAVRVDAMAVIEQISPEGPHAMDREKYQRLLKNAQEEHVLLLTSLDKAKQDLENAEAMGEAAYLMGEKFQEETKKNIVGAKSHEKNVKKKALQAENRITKWSVKLAEADEVEPHEISQINSAMERNGPTLTVFFCLREKIGKKLRQVDFYDNLWSLVILARKWGFAREATWLEAHANYRQGMGKLSSYIAGQMIASDKGEFTYLKDEIPPETCQLLANGERILALDIKYREIARWVVSPHGDVFLVNKINRFWKLQKYSEKQVFVI